MDRWRNQEEAVAFAMDRPSTMLNMGMGTGKTRVALDVAFMRDDVHRVLVVCPKSVLMDEVWRKNIEKFHDGDKEWAYVGLIKGTVKDKAKDVKEICEAFSEVKLFVVVNYEIVWRAELGDALRAIGFDMVVLDESHRAKSAGSKVSKYLYLLGKRTKYKMCLSGTPMANSPLDVYGQYRFLDPSIFGTRHNDFLQKYAILGGPERRFIVGLKNLNELDERFDSIAYSCSMSDVAGRLKLPAELPPIERGVALSSGDMNTLKKLKKEFIADTEDGMIVVKNVLGMILRMQQITSGFCMVTPSPGMPEVPRDLNTVKADQLRDDLQDISPRASVVVFCVFHHDLDLVHLAGREAQRDTFEVSGRLYQLDEWRKTSGAVLAIQIQSGAEGIDLTNSNYAIYFSLPHSLAVYEQSKARLYRPGQERPVSFIHYLARGTIDETMYQSLLHKRDLIDDICNRRIDVASL